MLALGDDVPLLTLRAAGARLQLHGDQVLAEIAGEGVDCEAAAVARLDGRGGEGARGGFVARVGFLGGFGVEDKAGSLDGGLAGGGVLARVERVGRVGEGEDEGDESGERDEEGGEVHGFWGFLVTEMYLLESGYVYGSRSVESAQRRQKRMERLGKKDWAMMG